MADIKDRIKMILKEDSTQDALKTLNACIKFYEDSDSNDDTTKEILGKLKGMKDWYDKNGSFTPGQAKAIYNVSMGIKKMTS